MVDSLDLIGISTEFQLSGDWIFGGFDCVTDAGTSKPSVRLAKIGCDDIIREIRPMIQDLTDGDDQDGHAPSVNGVRNETLAPTASVDPLLHRTLRFRATEQIQILRIGSSSWIESDSHLKVHHTLKLMAFSQVKEDNQEKWAITARNWNHSENERYIHISTSTIQINVSLSVFQCYIKIWNKVQTTENLMDDFGIRIGHLDTEMDGPQTGVHGGQGCHVTHDDDSVDVADLRKRHEAQKDHDEEDETHDEKIWVEGQRPRIVLCFGQTNHRPFLLRTIVAFEC